MTVAYGIDFGTTNSVVALATNTSVEAIKLEQQIPIEWANTGFDKVLPSVIGITGDSPVFGWAAKQMTENKLEAVKRLFATDDTITIGPTTLRVEEAAATFFRQLQVQTAEAGARDKLDRAVVTIPANSRGKARYRTKLSAGLAGIEVMALINEPTAAAMAHSRAIGDNQRILVFDWGGGTLDVTVLQAVAGTFIEQSSKGIQRHGGIDVDQALIEWLLPRIPGSDGWTASQHALFRLNVELAKIQLSSQTETQLTLPSGGLHPLTRAQLEEAAHPLFDGCRGPVDQCLRESPGRIDHLVMVGGSSKIPAIQTFVSSLVGTEPTSGVDPMTAIAEGAAIAAGILLDIIDDVDFFVGTEHALGTIVHNSGASAEGEFSSLIGRNTKLPAQARDSYTPANDNQEFVSVQVVEGDPSLPIGHEDNVVLKDWSVKLLEPRPRDEAGFDITYEYDVDGILHVIVQDQKTGTIMMNEELSFGAGEDRSQLPQMRQTVDGLMDRSAPSAASISAGSHLSVESQQAIDKARTKVIPFVPDGDREKLEDLVTHLESAAPGEEDERRGALDAEIRNHSYLL